jgi:6,7-dimethyl-8-ribityllumazine synthase
MRIDETPGVDLDASGLRIAVVTSIFNGSITAGLRAGAVDYLEEASAEEVLLVEAPGAFELPLIAQKLAAGGYHAIVCLGAVIEGDTDHYDHVAHRTSEGLMRVQLDTGVPVAFGVLAVRDRSHAEDRSAPGPENKGREAAIAAVMAARALAALD